MNTSASNSFGKLASAASLFAMLAAAQPAFAQSAETAASEEDGAIIVTARRQEERLQDVPASVAVLTATTLERTVPTPRAISLSSPPA